MSQAVIIKSNQYGINLILDPDVPFQELVDAVIEKFQEAEKFFKNAKLGISFEGRKLTSEEECRIIEAITEHTSIQILCIIDNDEHSAEETKKKIDEFLRLQQQYAVNVEAQGEFYKGTLHRTELKNSSLIGHSSAPPCVLHPQPYRILSVPGHSNRPVPKEYLLSCCKAC